ncbi:hypothetical protein ACFT0G_06065 [Streptomyces sp. NPDC057020]|uniref:hypothetical protein n=1 Tax=unclassified Streptomyces TaxID=2593676 RepID=UPI003629B7E6
MPKRGKKKTTTSQRPRTPRSRSRTVVDAVLQAVTVAVATAVAQAVTSGALDAMTTH